MYIFPPSAPGIVLPRFKAGPVRVYLPYASIVLTQSSFPDAESECHQKFKEIAGWFYLGLPLAIVNVVGGARWASPLPRVMWLAQDDDCFSMCVGAL